jgi:hypothetical protein
MNMRAKAIGGLTLALLAVGCVPGVDLSQLHPGDGGFDQIETVGDAVDLGDHADAVHGDADAPDTDGLGPDVDADFADVVDDALGDTEVDVEAGADADADTDVPACDPSACSAACSSSGYPGGSCSGPTCVCDPICVPDCVGRECGDDGCGTPCGTCGATERCTTTRHCREIVDDCAGADPTAACQTYCNSTCGTWDPTTYTYICIPDPYTVGPTGTCCPPGGCCTPGFTCPWSRGGCWCMCSETVHGTYRFCREPPPEG